MRLHEFTERYNLCGITEETLENVSPELKVACWNVIVKFTDPSTNYYSISPFEYPDFVHALGEFFSIPNDIDFPRSTVALQAKTKPLFFKLNGKTFYDLLNFLSLKSTQICICIGENAGFFSEHINTILISKGSPCRFVNGLLTLLTAPEQLQSIQNATNTEYKTVNNLILQAANKLYFGNLTEACADAIGAVESLLKNFYKVDKEDFDKLVSKMDIDNGFKQSIKNMWGYVSNRCRHKNGDTFQAYIPDQADAKLVVVWCSIIISYLNERKPTHVQ
ncbi:MAG: AbiJ-NTD4 domain-containing protein [Gammaproteobacteria bacterium]